MQVKIKGKESPVEVCGFAFEGLTAPPQGRSVRH